MLAAIAAGCRNASAPPVAASAAPTPVDAARCTAATLAALDVPVGSVLRSDPLAHPGAVAAVRLHWFPPAGAAGDSRNRLIAELSARGYRASVAGDDGPATLVDVLCPVGAPVSAAAPAVMPTATIHASTSSSPTSAPPDDSALGRQLLQEAIAAAGGASALSSIHDVEMSTDTTAVVDKARAVAMGIPEIKTRTIEYQRRDGAFREETDETGLPEPSTTVFAVSPGGGFMSLGGAPVPLQGADLARQRAEGRFTPLGLLLHGGDPDVSLGGASGIALDTLEVTPGGGPTVVFSLDSRTHLVSQRVIGGSKVTYDDYRPESGVLMPHLVTLRSAVTTTTLKFTKVVVNGGLPADAFTMP